MHRWVNGHDCDHDRVRVYKLQGVERTLKPMRRTYCGVYPASEPLRVRRDSYACEAVTAYTVQLFSTIARTAGTCPQSMLHMFRVLLGIPTYARYTVLCTHTGAGTAVVSSVR